MSQKYHCTVFCTLVGWPVQYYSTMSSTAMVEDSKFEYGTLQHAALYYIPTVQTVQLLLYYIFHIWSKYFITFFRQPSFFCVRCLFSLVYLFRGVRHCSYWTAEIMKPGWWKPTVFGVAWKYPLQ